MNGTVQCHSCHPFQAVNRVNGVECHRRHGIVQLLKTISTSVGRDYFSALSLRYNKVPPVKVEAPHMGPLAAIIFPHLLIARQDNFHKQGR